MAELINNFDLTEQPLISDQPQTGQYLKNLKQATVGAGTYQTNISNEGLWIGADKFEDAPFSVTPEGVINASSGTFSGALSSATGTFTGKVEIKDGSNNVVILLDPNG